MRDRPLLLFDGVCNLCNSSVQWILARDSAERFDFASLQSAVARDALRETYPQGDWPDTVILIDARGVHIRSNAALAVARQLGPPWSLLAAFKLIPRPLRDALYRWVAAHRYRWFGKRESCSLPKPGQAARFLDANE